MQFDPAPNSWSALLRTARDDKTQAMFLGRSAHAWRQLTRRELGVPSEGAVIATGHEAVLWHPGILAKYIAMHAWAQHCGASCVHLVVDQHVGGFTEIDVPVRRDDGALAVETITLGAAEPDTPMGWHAPLDPPEVGLRRQPALESVRDGLDRILDFVRKYRGEPNAAAQMGRVLDDLLEPWMPKLPAITATNLMTTSLARAFVQALVENPRAAIAHYNNAVVQVPEAGIGGLAVSSSAIELPLWRIDGDGKRQRAFDHDAREWLANPRKFALLPRALTMTALLRLGACDIFIHGFGGARYDPAMEQWIASWLGATPQPIVMVSATLRLPLAPDGDEALDVCTERHGWRHAMHDPTAVGSGAPSAAKAAWLEKINALPRRSVERKQAFLAMHDQLESLRRQHADVIAAARKRFERATQQQRERDIVNRRTWPFPFYPRTMIDSMASAITEHVTAGCRQAATATSAQLPAR